MKQQRVGQIFQACGVVQVLLDMPRCGIVTFCGRRSALYALEVLGCSLCGRGGES